MACLSGDGSGNRNEKGPTNNYKPSPKRPRVSTPISNTQRRAPPVAAVPRLAAARAAMPRPAATTTTTNPAGLPRPTESEEESSEETDSTSFSSSSWSDSSSDSESESVHNPTLHSNGASGDSEGQSRRGTLSATLTDLDVLDCPICSEPLCSPVYQCENGHIACGSCCTRMKNKCSNCRRSVGIIRCRALERVLEFLTVPCRNKPYGCLETLNYSKKLDDHEKTCRCAPCSCPYISCKYVGISKCLYGHFAQAHSQSSKQFAFDSVVSISLDKYQMHVYLQERSHSTVFILHGRIKSRWSSVYVVCVAPVSENRSFLYDLTAITAGDTSMNIRTSVECVRKWTDQDRSRKCLILPRDLIDPRGQLKLELVIRRNPASGS